MAKLAGVPKAVVENAKKILTTLEKQEKVSVTSEIKETEETEDTLQLSFSSGEKEQIIEKLKSIDVNTLTPIEAMTVLFELQKSAENL